LHALERRRSGDRGDVIRSRWREWCYGARCALDLTQAKSGSLCERLVPDPLLEEQARPLFRWCGLDRDRRLPGSQSPREGNDLRVVADTLEIDADLEV
jgi:hypothetical protein